MSTHNSLGEEVREQRRKALSGKPLKDKASYIFYYYKKHIIIGIIIVCVIISTVNHIINQKSNALSVALVNCNKEVDYEQMLEEYFITTGLDDSYAMSVDPTYVMVNGKLDYQLEQKFFMATAAGQVDVVMAPASFFDIYASLGYMKNLDGLLTEEQKQEYKDVLHEVKTDIDHGNQVEVSGIDISDFNMIVDGKWFVDCDEPIYFGIPIESVNDAQAIDYLYYLRNSQNIIKK